MGNFTSAFGGSVPKDPDDTLNYILRGIFSNIDLMDMYAMMDQKKCAEYVIFGERALDSIFMKMNLMPARDNRGYIYFRKMTTLKSELERSDDHKKMCKEIAWFFATLLRSFGALWMSIKQANRPLTQISGVTESPTGQIFQQKSTVRKIFDRIVGQIGGSINNPVNGVELLEATNMNESKMLGRFIKQYFNAGGDVQYFELDNTRESERSLKLDTKTVYYLDDSRGSPQLARPQPITPPPTVPFRAITSGGANETLFSILSTQGAQGAVEIHYEDAAPPQLIYSFGNGRNKEFSYSFNMRIEHRGMSDTNFRVTLENFSWVTQPPKVLNEINRFKRTFEAVLSGSSKLYILINGNPGRFDLYLLSICKEIEEKVYENPNITTSDYLVKWKYIDENSSAGTRPALYNINPRDLYFDESTRKNQTVKITYLKYGVKIPGRSEADTLQIDCYLMITRRNSADSGKINEYTVIVSNLTAIAKSRVNLEGIFTPLQAQVESRTFTAFSDTDPPTNSSGLDIPKFIRRVADRQINLNVTERDVAYRRVRAGDYLRIPVANSSNPYDLGKLQDMMTPTKSPFPACTALAAELVQNLKTNPITAVCNSKFSARLDGSLPRGRGTELRTSTGILALSALFIDSMNSDAKGVVETAEWKEFVENMKAVSAYDLKERCKTTDSSMELDRSLAGQVNDIVQQLMDRQRAHNEAAFTLVWELFDQSAAQERRGFRINEMLYSGGMRRLLEVRDRCIDLLTRYYVDCDSLYLKGVRMIIDQQGAPIAEQPQQQQQRRDENEENHDEPDNETYRV